KFAVLIAVLLGTLLWLAASGLGEAKSYYRTVAELNRMGPAALGKRLRVAGDVEPGSIRRTGAEVRFVLRQNELRLPVLYRGSDPLPDTFRDGAQAVADGRMTREGVFQASRIQAKCASKYEAKPNRRPATAAAPVNQAGF
ncbi:MAG: cytochrome c maturation protein CcmE, partial [Bryobacteraceae bacterium]